MMRVLSREPERSIFGLRKQLGQIRAREWRGVSSLLERGSQAGDPAGVALKGTAEDELLRRHVGGLEVVKVLVSDSR